MNVHTGKALDVPGGNLNPGTRIQQFALHGGDNQQWRFETTPAIRDPNALSPELQRIFNKTSGLALDIPNGSQVWGTEVQQWTPNTGLNQTWILRGLERPRTNMMVFFEGKDATQNSLDSINDSPGQSLRPRHNDEASSVVLFGVRAGAVISVFDDSRGRPTDDHCVITVKKSSPRYVVGSFERSYEDGDVKVVYSGGNGLNGKVSRIKVD